MGEAKKEIENERRYDSKDRRVQTEIDLKFEIRIGLVTQFEIQTSVF